jgi:hypothetical protein
MAPRSHLVLSIPYLPIFLLPFNVPFLPFIDVDLQLIGRLIYFPDICTQHDSFSCTRRARIVSPFEIMLSLPFWTLPAVFLILWLSGLGYRLATNYFIARKVGVPMILVPFDPGSPMWMIFSDVFGKKLEFVLKRTPFLSSNPMRYVHRCFEVQDRAKTFLELGDAFILVTTGRNWFYNCNADTHAEVYQRRHDFKRPPEIMGRYSLSALCSRY